MRFWKAVGVAAWGRGRGILIGCLHGVFGVPGRLNVSCSARNWPRGRHGGGAAGRASRRELARATICGAGALLSTRATCPQATLAPRTSPRRAAPLLLALEVLMAEDRAIPTDAYEGRRGSKTACRRNCPADRFCVTRRPYTGPQRALSWCLERGIRQRNDLHTRSGGTKYGDENGKGSTAKAAPARGARRDHRRRCALAVERPFGAIDLSRFGGHC